MEPIRRREDTSFGLFPVKKANSCLLRLCAQLLLHCGVCLISTVIIYGLDRVFTAECFPYHQHSLFIQ
ncbi:hypothetical protein SK128_019513, partial [Halocaridina rubra]